MSRKWPILLLILTSLVSSKDGAASCEPNATPDCDNPAARLQQAAALNAAQRFTEAADLLESLLMADPDNTDALELYRQALIGMDRRGEQQSTATNEQHDAGASDWRTGGSMLVRAGYGSNLNQAPTQSTIQLTLPAQSIALELDSEFLRQAGFGFETQLVGNAIKALSSEWNWQIRGELYNRETGYEGFADYQGANVMSMLTRAAEGTESGAALAIDGLRYGGDTYLYTARLLLRHAGRKIGQCRPQYGLDGLWQRQHDSPFLDSRYAGVMLGGWCDTDWGYYSAALSAGWDWADPQRPGGNQQRTRLEIIGSWPTDIWVEDSYLSARVSYLHGLDMEAYSPWLSRGADRTIDRIGLGLDYEWTLGWIGKDWRGIANVNWQNQDSNIELFQTNAVEGWLGVKVVW